MARPAVNDSQVWGWAFQILPYIDQGPLWNLPQGSAGDNEVAAAMIPIYFCPLVGNPRQNTSYNQGSPSGTTIRGEADYTANAGSWGSFGECRPQQQFL